MVAITASDFDTIMHLSGGVADEDIEAILDQAINQLNIYGCGLSNMTGVAGAKTVTLTSAQKASVFIAARAIYHGFYKSIEPSASVGGLLVSSTDLMSNPVVLSSIKRAAWQLLGRSIERV